MGIDLNIKAKASSLGDAEINKFGRILELNRILREELGCSELEVFAVGSIQGDEENSIPRYSVDSLFSLQKELALRIHRQLEGHRQLGIVPTEFNISDGAASDTELKSLFAVRAAIYHEK